MADSKLANQEFQAPEAKGFKVAEAGGSQVGSIAAETVYVEYVNGDHEDTKITRKQPEKGYVLVHEGDSITQAMINTLNEGKG